MYLVRVNHKNNLYLEFIFLDPGRADEAAATCAQAKLRGNSHPPKDSACEVRDDAGRVTWLEGGQIQSVQLVSLEEEVRFNTRMRIVAEETAKDFLQRIGYVDQAEQVNGHAAERPDMNTVNTGPVDSPAIGRFSS